MCTGSARKRGKKGATLTEDEFLRRRHHVQREGHLVLVALLLHPAQQLGGTEDGGGDGEGRDAAQHRERRVGDVGEHGERLFGSDVVLVWW